MFRILVIQVKNETSPWFLSIPPSCATFSFLEDQNASWKVAGVPWSYFDSRHNLVTHQIQR